VLRASGRCVIIRDRRQQAVLARGGALVNAPI
jgi:hypothetical protein